MTKNPFDLYKERAVVGEKRVFSSPMITSRRFADLSPFTPYGYDRKPQFNTETQNVHTLFRKSFSVLGKVKRARLFITGDDLYKVYLGGRYVGEGPAQSFPYAYNYSCYDVTDMLAEGENLLAVHLYYQGLFNIYMMSADHRCGLLCELSIEYESGKKDVVCSGANWKYAECDAFTPKYLYGYQTQFSEDIDLRRIPEGWRECDFDDSGWESAVCFDANAAGYVLQPQITPPVSYRRLYPVSVTEIPDGYLFDFGAEAVGSLCFPIAGEAGQEIELRYAEELDGTGRARYDIRANCTYSDRITLSGKDTLLEYFDYKGYRYAELLHPPRDLDPASVYTLERHYPFPEESAKFLCSDEKMNRIFEICERGVRIGTQDTYYDCPTREKGGFVGDALITGLSHLLLTGDFAIYKKFILDCKETGKHCPVIPAHLPTYNINFCADYSLLIPLFVKEYYERTGDTALVREMLPTLEGILGYFEKFRNADGLLEKIAHFDGVPEYLSPILIDWPQNLRDGYDMEGVTAGVCTTVNVFYYGFLKTTAALYAIAKNTARERELSAMAEQAERGLNATLYDEETGLYLDASGSHHSAIHANALQLFFGMKPPKGYAPIRDMLLERRLNCGVYFSYFVIEGLFRIGEAEAALDLLRGEDEHSWVNMLKSGATTCMEAWGPDQKWNTSWCHPWSSSPIYFYFRRILGIDLNACGERRIRIAPIFPRDLSFASLEMPSPHGKIKAEIRRAKNTLRYTLTAPRDVEILFAGEGMEFIRAYGE